MLFLKKSSHKMNSDQEGIEANSMLAKAKGDPSIAQLFGFLFMKSSGE